MVCGCMDVMFTSPGKFVSIVIYKNLLQFFFCSHRLGYMYRLSTFGVLLLFSIKALAQDDQLLVYDANSYSSSVKQFNSEPIDLEGLKAKNYTQSWQMPNPSMFCTSRSSKFSEMQASCSFLSPDQYPASATVKIVSIHGDTTWDKCSGMIVGDRYVLTAGHCVINDEDGWKDIKGFVPNMYVRPGYDKGVDSKYGKIKVEKIYIFKSYFMGKSKKDIALLELSQPIGVQTGWVNMDFEDDNLKAISTRFYNFSYPMDASKVNYYRNYNGDTLYLKSGYPDNISQHYIGINGVGIPGESGSLLIADDNNGFTAYGVRNFSEEKFSFYRLKKEDVTIFYNIINRNKAPKPTVPLVVKNTSMNGVSIYPNPVFEKAIITTHSAITHIQVNCFDASGSKVYNTNLTGNQGRFVFENYNLPQGNYLLIVEQNNIYLGTAKVVISK